MISVTRKATATADVLGREDAVEVEVDLQTPRANSGALARSSAASSVSRVRSAMPRFSSISAKWLRWTIDKRADPAADAGIGGARFGRLGAAAVDVEQGRDDLQVVLHPVVDFADQPPLAVERCGHVRSDSSIRVVARLKRASAWISRAGPSLCGSSKLASPGS